MEVVKLFADLESNNSQIVEETKKKITEIFSSTKETWLVHGMLDYFGQTNSNRIVDILVKVQAPHDKFIFDKLYDWIRGSNKILGLTLFGHIIRKHPTWLYKVASHTLMKEVLKLLKTEKEIIPLMSALLCIILLLPIIPFYMGNFVTDLFDIFSYLASWNCHNPTNLPDDQLIHLQFGLYSLFHRLYGMYPCNFIEFLRQEYIVRDKAAIFQHTIKPLLETVKMHPLLVCSDKGSEIKAARWKKMEPHDVVNECARFSLDYMERTQEISSTDCDTFMTPIKPLEYSSNLIDIQLRSNENYIGKDFVSLSSDQKHHPSIIHQSMYWTPSNVVQPTPPPTGTVPHTPTLTPNYTIPLISGSQSTADGASPPEAAVEATPETTPQLKDTFKAVRPYPVNSPVVRAMWPTSQPSSPIKKETSHFSYETSAVMSPQKLLRMVSDRNHSIIQMANSSTTSGPSSPLPIETQPLQLPKLRFDNPITAHTVDSMRNLEQNKAMQEFLSTKEDQEVTDIINQLQNVPEANNTNNSQHPVLTKEMSVECEDFEQEEGSPCSAGGLHIPNSNSMRDFAIRVNRFRMYSHCVGDINSSYSAGTSPAEGNCMPRSPNNNFPINGNAQIQLKYRRSSSWPDLKSKNKFAYTAETPTTLSIVKTQIHKTIETNGSTSSSPSDEEAISAATHFRHQEQKNSANNTMADKMLNLQHIRNKLCLSNQTSKSTQTIQVWPQPYENMLYGILQDENRNKSSLEHQNNSQGQQKQFRFTPNMMLDEHIELCIRNKPSNDNRKLEDIYRDHIRLLNLHLQYEKHRREIHAERNRRLLGKSRAIRALEQNNETLKDQVARLTSEISSLNTQLIDCRRKLMAENAESIQDSQQWKLKFQQEANENKQLRTTIENLQIRLSEEAKLRKETTLSIESARGELFDLQNEMQQATYKAELGQQYREELTKLQSEMIVMGEIQLKCKEKLGELNNIKAREMEFSQIHESYLEEVRDLRTTLELKTSQLDTAKARLAELESQLIRRDIMFTDQKRMLKSVKEEYQEKFNSLEKKYTAQKAIILRLEEHILELYKNLTAVNIATLSPESERTDMVGSLDHTSPLSLSLASSDGLSASLRSVTEIKNLQALVVQPPNNNNNTTNNNNNMHPSSSMVSTVVVGSNRQTQSEDIPVPGPSQHYHH